MSPRCDLLILVNKAVKEKDQLYKRQEEEEKKYFFNS
jgi:hypothetical protein